MGASPYIFVYEMSVYEITKGLASKALYGLDP